MHFYKGLIRIFPPQDPVTPDMLPACSAGDIDENSGGIILIPLLRIPFEQGCLAKGSLMFFFFKKGHPPPPTLFHAWHAPLQGYKKMAEQDPEPVI
jgi:hypothetical protein